MRGLSYRWIERPAAPPSSTSRSTGLVARVLAARGIDDVDGAFTEPKLSGLHDPSLLPGLDIAAERILKAARDGEQIVIWGDYDVDGVTAAAILYHTIRSLAPGAMVRTHIPHRIDEGYGLNSDGVRAVIDEGASVIVTVDCGVTATEPANVAASRGVDLIITDHHTPPSSEQDLPPAFAVVHPGLPSSKYPFHDLCGAGVAYKLAWRISTLAFGSDRVDEATRTMLIEHLALASLGTIADVVPLLNENRIIARFGLSRVASTSNIGLQALIEASGLRGERIRSEDVGFRLGPRLNACGRMGHAREALELFTTESPTRAAELAAQLTRMNEERRATERQIAQEAAAAADSEGQIQDDHRAIVLAHPNWHPGVVGIVCSRLVERFGRPTVLLCENDGECFGSCRSIDGFDIHAALCQCEDVLMTFGGHAMAAGLRLKREHLEDFRARFVSCANEHLSPDDLIRALTIDCDATFDELTPQTVMGLERLAPFGRSNPAPVIRTRNAIVDDAPTPLGQHGKHLAIRLRHGGRVLKTLAWNWGDRRSTFHIGDEVDILIEPKLNTWRGVTSVEPHLLDVRFLNR